MDAVVTGEATWLKGVVGSEESSAPLRGATVAEVLGSDETAVAIKRVAPHVGQTIEVEAGGAPVIL